MFIQQYIDTITKRFDSGISREHSYRADLENLLRAMVTTVEITNEPANVTDCGNPDYVITKGKIPIGYIEAKDIAKDLNSKSYKEQFGRYRNALDNLIITDYLWFQFFQNGEMVHEIRIGEIVNGIVKPLPENFDKFENLIQDFCTFVSQTIKSPKKLAVMMAAKARLLQDILEQAVESDEQTQANTSLKAQYETFKDILIHDLKPKGFADIYAQTLAYGMFAARLNDDTIDTFSRQEAAELIPKSNPFLRKLFGYVAGPDIDERIKPTVENLAEVFRHTNVEELLKNFGNSTQTNDPIIHFYETFLAEYDPKLRKSRGVWYTPEPVVSFIVRAVDDILKTEFGLAKGLADTTKTKIKVDVQGKVQEQEVHKVQILDPATGTGTFLAEVVKYIYNNNFKQMQGMWSSYVDEHLIPRLNGFELLMASYAMAHLKLSMLLAETGYKAKSDQRLNVYLTNSLEEHHKDTGTIFSSWLSAESNEANRIKRDVPVMCVIGNPPYSGESANKGDWIMNLMEDYKKEPGGKVKLKERNPKWINDDYVKFIRYGQYHIEKNGTGILAFINPHGFLDNPTFRGMRWNLLKTYDKIYTIDLHGNAKKKETTPDGGKDENVFDIMQGVSINIFIKTGQKKKNELGKVFHYDKYGKRDEKYEFLSNSSLKDISYVLLPKNEPMHFMVQKDYSSFDKFNSGFSINTLFPTNNVGIVTSRDGFVISESKSELEKRIQMFFEEEKSLLLSKYDLRENKGWKIDTVKKNAVRFNLSAIRQVNYRPFNTRFIYYNDFFIERSRKEVMQHFLNGKNVGLTLCKQFKSGNDYQHIFISNTIIESSFVSNKTSEITSLFPLYLYPEAGEQATLDKSGEATSPSFGHPSKGGEYQGEKDENSPPLEGWTAKQDGVVDTTGRDGSKIARSYRKYAELPFNPALKQRAKDLRKAGNLSEVLMWLQLKKGQIEGLDFDRQKIIGSYIVDFFNANLGLVIEIDGSSHDEKQEYDEYRQAFLEGLGLIVVRYNDREVKNNMDGVIANLKEVCSGLLGDMNSTETPLTTPSFGHPSTGGELGRTPNLDMKLVGEIAKGLGLEFRDVAPWDEDELSLRGAEPRGNLTNEVQKSERFPRSARNDIYFTPIDLLDYIYAVLHSPTYREKYKEFLKIDFPRVPYPKNKQKFWQLVDLGSQIRQLHLLETADNYITSYPIDGTNIIERKMTKNSIGYEQTGDGIGRVWINDEQYFDGVPKLAWEFYIGGYQPAQKWLKDRQGRELNFEDIIHYQKIIVALTETDRLMKEIDKVGVE